MSFFVAVILLFRSSFAADIKGCEKSGPGVCSDDDTERGNTDLSHVGMGFQDFVTDEFNILAAVRVQQQHVQPAGLDPAQIVQNAVTDHVQSFLSELTHLQEKKQEYTV